MKHIKSLYTFLFESKSTEKLEQAKIERRTRLLDALLEIYEIFEGSPLITLTGNDFQYRDLLKKHGVTNLVAVSKFITKHFLNSNKVGRGSMEYSLKSSEIPTLSLVDLILKETADREKSKYAKRSEFDPRFKGLSEDAQLALALQIIRDGIVNGKGNIATDLIWHSTDIYNKYIINEACLNLGIYLRKGHLKYEWLSDEPIEDLVRKIKKEMRRINHVANMKHSEKMWNLRETPDARWRDTEFDVKDKHFNDYHRILNFYRYHLKKGKSIKEIYDMLISKPNRYNRKMVDIIFKEKIK